MTYVVETVMTVGTVETVGPVVTAVMEGTVWTVVFVVVGSVVM